MSAVRQNWRIQRLAVQCELVAARPRLKLRQVDVAKAIGVSRRTFQRFENADLEPSADELFAWASALGLAFTIAPVSQPQVAA